jgi:hypothetical protein
MAQTRRSSLASYALEEAYVPLPSPASLPDPSEAQEMASELPSLNRRNKTVLVNYPCRLRADQIAALTHLRDTLGVLPAELIRDFVDLGLRKVKAEGVGR